MTRREMLAAAAITPLIGTSAKPILGGSPTSFNVRARAAKRTNQIFDVVEHCHQLGLTGAEAGLFVPTPDGISSMRHKIESYGMTVVLNIPLPKSQSDLAQFDKAVAAAKETGAIALHAAMTQRRYEQFDSLAAFQANFAQCQRSVEMAEPVLAKHRLPLAIENHKGWRAAEQAAWMKRVSSQWVGVCVDMGNNLSLCEMPDETFDALTPYAIFSHLKDMGLEEYSDGFLLAEVPLGQGVIDVPKRVAQLRGKDPKMLFCIEMITRDPLKIPIYTDHYWLTFSDPNSTIPGRDVAEVLELVKKNPPKTPLPRPDELSPEDQLKAEDRYNLACIQYARQTLEM